MGKKSNLQEFLEKCYVVHGNRYDYSLAEYINNSTKLKIKCKIHGLFYQTPNSHLSGSNCNICANEKQNQTKFSNTVAFIEKANKVHSSFYDYSKSIYKHNKENITITCVLHGDFLQTPHVHLRGNGCRLCANERLSKKFRKPYDLVLKEYNDKYFGIYEYPKEEEFEYKNSSSEINIFCKKHNFTFTTTIDGHLCGRFCEKCLGYFTSKGELSIGSFLEKHNIEFVKEKTFPDLKGVNGYPLRYDFYIESLNTIVEFDGEQHFKVKFNSSRFSQEKFKQTQKHDKIKNLFCKKNKITLIRIPYYQYDKIGEILEANLLNKLKK